MLPNEFVVIDNPSPTLKIGEIYANRMFSEISVNGRFSARRETTAKSAFQNLLWALLGAGTDRRIIAVSRPEPSSDWSMNSRKSISNYSRKIFENIS
jgi:hypothetical protein